MAEKAQRSFAGSSLSKIYSLQFIYDQLNIAGCSCLCMLVAADISNLFHILLTLVLYTSEFHDFLFLLISFDSVHYCHVLYRILLLLPTCVLCYLLLLFFMTVDWQCEYLFLSIYIFLITHISQFILVNFSVTALPWCFAVRCSFQ